MFSPRDAVPESIVGTLSLSQIQIDTTVIHF